MPVQDGWIGRLSPQQPRIMRCERPLDRPVLSVVLGTVGGPMPQHVVGSSIPTENGRPPNAEERSRPHWWLRGALIGLVVGWIIGLVVVRPGADDLLNAALDLVPEAAEVTHTGISGEDFELIAFTGPPRAWVEVTTDLTPEELTEDFELVASTRGWTVLPRVRRPGTIAVPLRSLLLRGQATSLVRQNSGPLPGPDARINVRRHDWTGKVVTGTSSIIGAIMGGAVVWYLYRWVRGNTTPHHAPIRWWHLAGLIVLAAFWLRALSIIR